MKKIVIALLVVVLLALGGGLWLRGSLDRAVKSAIERYGSEMLQARVSVDSVEIQPADGRGVIRGLVVGNPPGFRTAYALRVTEIEVVLDLSTLTQPVITLKKINVLAPEVVFEKSGNLTNFDVLQANIKTYLSAAPSQAREVNGTAGRKLIVDELLIGNPRAQVAATILGNKTVGIKLPGIALRDVGRAAGGLSPGELGQEVANALKTRWVASVNFADLKRSLGKTLEDAGNAIKGLWGK